MYLACWSQMWRGCRWRKWLSTRFRCPPFSSDSKIASCLLTYARYDEKVAQGRNSLTDTWCHHSGVLIGNLEFHSCSQEHQYVSLQKEARCYVYRNPTFVLIRRETIPVHHLLSTSLRYILILSTHQRSHFPSSWFPSSCPTQTLDTLVFSHPVF